MAHRRALPGNQLLVEDGRVRVVPGPSVNGHRPAIDPLFRSASLVYGPRVVGVILSGTGDDGTAGLATIKKRGGVAIVQEPANALFAGMPQSAIEHVSVDEVLPISGIAPVLVRLAHQAVERPMPPPSPELELEVEFAGLGPIAFEDNERFGFPSAFSCPECGGVLRELDDGKLVQFRCRTGHAFSLDSLASEQSQALETALWAALRALEEKVSLSRRVAKQARVRGNKLTAGRFGEEARNAAEQAEFIRSAILTTRQYLSAELTETQQVEYEIEIEEKTRKVETE